MRAKCQEVPMEQIEQICARSLEQCKGDKQKSYEYAKHTIWTMNLFDDCYERALFNICNVLKF